MLKGTGPAADPSPSASGFGPRRSSAEARREEGPPPGWDRRAVLADVPAGAGPAARYLERRLFAAAEAPPRPPDPLDSDDVWKAVACLRRAICGLEEEGRVRPARLARLHARLDAEAGRLADEVLRRAVSESHRMLANVSHDIRSPLNSILFLADTLLNEHSGDLNDVQRRQVGVLYTAAVTLVNLVNDLIDASRLDEGHEIAVSSAAFSVESTLSDIRSLLIPLAGHRGVQLRFHVETLGPRLGDRQLVSRVLLNLITNAIQAVDQGGSVDVRVSQPRTGWLRLEVVDDGPGGDLEELRRYLADDSDATLPIGRTKGWTHGLGLAITARLIRAAGGVIDVQSEAGEGTHFVADVPFAAADRPPAAPAGD